MSNEITVRVGADIQRYRRAMSDVVSEAKRTSGLVAAAAGGMGGALQGAAVTGGRAFSSFFSTAKRQFEVLGTHLLGIRTALAGLVGGFFLVRFIKQFVDAGQEMENFQIQLNAVFRGADILARDALRNVIEFARVTPFTTQETIQAFTMLRSVGFDVTNDVLEAIGNTAFVFNRRMTDVAMAMVSMETETLRRLGVVLDRTGEKARIMSGGVTKVVENTREAIFAGLVSLFQEIFPGAMKDAENTFRGAMANLFSLFEEFRYRVGAAVTGQLVPRIQKFIVLFEDLQKSGVIGQLEKDLTGLISSAVLGFADMVKAGVEWVVLHRDTIKKEVVDVWEGLKKVWQDAKGVFGTVWDVMKSAWNWYSELPDEFKAVGLIGLFLLGPVKGAALFGLLGLLKGEIRDLKSEMEGAGQPVEKPGQGGGVQKQGLFGGAIGMAEENPLAAGAAGAYLGGRFGLPGAVVGAGVGMAPFVWGAVNRSMTDLWDAITGAPAAKREVGSVLADTIVSSLKAASEEFKLDPRMLAALVASESSFRNVVTPTTVAGVPTQAIGLGQVTAVAGAEKGFSPQALLDPFQNLRATAMIFSELLREFEGDTQSAVIAYKAGRGNVAAFEQGRLEEKSSEEVRTGLSNFFKNLDLARQGLLSVPVVRTGKAPVVQAAAAGPAAEGELPLLGLMESMERERQQQDALTRDAINKIKLQAANAEAMIKKQKDSIDDVIESTMIELKTATLVGGALIEQKTALEGQLAVTKAIREAKEKEQDRFGKEQEQRIRDEMSVKYAELARVRVQTESNKNIVELIKSQRESIENLLIEVQTAEAVTEEERVQAELAKIKLDLQRKGVDFAKDLTDEQQKTTEQLILQGTRIKDILQRYQDLKDTIQEAFTGAVRNIQNSFADMWYNVFSGGTKRAKDFLREIADSFLKAVSQIQGAITATLMDRAVVAVAGALGFPNITSLKGLISTTSGSMAKSFMGGGGWGTAPAGVEGPVMEGGGFFSNALGWLSSLFFGEGGIMPGMQLMPLRHFASGGIVDQPMVGFVGENAPRQYEAVVPLKDNRYIPVQLGGGGGEQGAASRPVVSVTIRGDIRPEKPGMTKDEVISVFVDGMKHDTVIRQATRENLGRFGD